MTDVPRRRTLTNAERVRTVAATTYLNADLGGSSMAARARTTPTVGSSTGLVTVVFHGADGTEPRPTAAVVYWVGSATPANAMPYDFHYTADVE